MTSTQRLLSAEEIALQRAGEPAFVRLPDPAALFGERADRLAMLADGHPMSSYLDLIGQLSRAQHRVLGDWPAPLPARFALPDRAAVALAAEHLMPPLAVSSWRRDPAWRGLLPALLDAIAAQAGDAGLGLSDATEALFARLRAADADWLEDQANRILNDKELGLDRAAAIFVAAALQVYWSRLVVDTHALHGERTYGRLSSGTVCPCCGSRPVASIFRASGAGSHRYLACRLCAAEWYLERIKCPTCESTAGIEYFHVDVVSLVARAETCSACNTYTKILATDKVPGVEPVADDLASIGLDMAIAEQTGLMRATLNLAFFPGEDDGEDGGGEGGQDGGNGGAAPAGSP